MSRMSDRGLLSALSFVLCYLLSKLHHSTPFNQLNKFSAENEFSLVSKQKKRVWLRPTVLVLAVGRLRAVG